VKPIVLASASAVRARLLAAAGLDVEITPSGVDETVIKQERLAAGAAPDAIAEVLAEAKALAVSRRTSALVIGADQTLEFGGTLFDKTSSLEETRDLLRRLRGGAFELHCGAALAEGAVVRWRRTASARLTMRAFSDAFLEAYLARNAQALSSSLGGFELEGEGVQLFERVEGDYFTVLGLPLLDLLAALREAGGLEA
jgi:septum formation protein